MDYKITLSMPDITDTEKKAVMDVLNTPHLSLGKKYVEFQNTMAKFAGVKYAVAINSGTSGLHLIIKALGIGKGDEVITTPFSFIASSNCILYEGAKPVFVDIKSNTFNIDPELVEGLITSKTKAILVVDVFSHPADWKELQKIAKKHKLFLIEDSAEALGSEYFNRKCGSFGDASIFAFYPNKQITTGEGGMILTNNKKIANLCQSMANQGREIKNGKWLNHIRLGYNYRLDEMSSAMGIAQLKRIKEIVKKRNAVANLYAKKIKDILEIEVPFVAENCRLSWFVYVVKLSGKFAGKKRDKIIQEMAREGIQCSNYFQPIHLQPFYKKEFGYKEGNFPIAENVSKRTLALPFYNNLSEKEIDFVVKNLKEIINEIK
ncbi:MAG: polysaccharide biosynthesis protein [Candidatus Staskawiczbacteria bacterium RIFOXYD1_FULL_32_13]|uniref:Polysaccharide biosynthesis protein n=1 Tax=Candidatus Staskawiczbacteria bacterium RIFOXYD1_FULL_32_13 TaxID=1802234 RepID=A0A1G2JQ64_9BACT|nr:MAG: Glutamine-scyllo-inositol transaminase [Parcubacteria group bacterium GW2011_GWC2_32_10]OGZ77742.1 MAG: polysaccharide biosynthesis protein [Candidatus Staskawiczbacteria bacterium RIFOXYA2_FULL_32_7]OGZ87082.1 MAG: polysaccharide biosynthesis protein [Candidatus Staskawiczbacteria bacterium RIFOXYC2_FULL_32_10]OGZ89275.1 MAG: polysaccharide biosynthesis protein [Candidatus Staskawiczbacteria bacterium RIFOXYD1_FULL_32_13]